MAGQKTVAASRDSSVYAEPRTVTDLEECYFYHSMEIPGYGLVEGPGTSAEASTTTSETST